MTLRYVGRSAAVVAAVRARPDQAEALLVEFAGALASASREHLARNQGVRMFSFAGGNVTARLELEPDGDVVAVEIIAVDLMGQ